MNDHNSKKDEWIISNRGEKNAVNARLPYSWMIEKEYFSDGKIIDVGIIFLTNKECPFHCLMCDLWKNTLNKSVSGGDIPNQIKYALERMQNVKHLKIYNSGSFFDSAAIPANDYSHIASLLDNYESVTVESHARFIDEKCLHFKKMLKPKLCVAIGLEIANDNMLLKLNKQMTLEDFKKAVNLLNENQISVRAFILLKPPFLDEDEGVYWAQRSIDFAFDSGVESCSVIPVRPGNAVIDSLIKSGCYTLPKIRSLYNVMEYGLKLNSGRIFADTWDLRIFSECPECFPKLLNNLVEMNLQQRFIKTDFNCSCVNN